MTLLLLFEALLKLLDQLFQPTQAFNLGFVLLRELLHKFRSQPIVGDHGLDDIIEGLKVLKMQTKRTVEAVVVFLVLNQNRARQ